VLRGQQKYQKFMVKYHCKQKEETKMELIVKEYEKKGKIEKIEIQNNTTGEIYTLSSPTIFYEEISRLGYNHSCVINFEFYSFDFEIKNEYVRIK
jgi:hypothetical protein